MLSVASKGGAHLPVIKGIHPSVTMADMKESNSILKPALCEGGTHFPFPKESILQITPDMNECYKELPTTNNPSHVIIVLQMGKLINQIYPNDTYLTTPKN